LKKKTHNKIKLVNLPILFF